MINSKLVCLIILFILSFLIAGNIWGNEMDSIYSDYRRPLSDGPYVIFQRDSLLILEIRADSLMINVQEIQAESTVYIQELGQYVSIQQDFPPSNISKFQICPWEPGTKLRLSFSK